MSMDLEENEEGIEEENLTCISQEYSPKAVSNLDLKNPYVHMHPVMLLADWRKTLLLGV